MTRFAGRVVLITGAAERAGAQIALAFARDGATVYINHFGQTVQAEETVRRAVAEALPGGLRAVEADVTDPAAVRAMVDGIVAESGRVDVLIHNASSFRPRPFADLTPAEVDASLGVNLRGPLFLSQAVGEVMRRQGTGRILAILGNSLSEAWPDLIPHIVGKSALGRLMEQLAVAYSPAVQCNSVAPTQFYRSDDGANDALRVARGEAPAAAGTTLVKGVAVREAQLTDVVDVLMFLADGPDSVSGVTIRLDGGRVHI
ncbi:SDR family NAD(P)-dependent oxidoreductase [uncultured Microbacterium sp.]|uniref:Putative Short-chain dehydrogenase/reductase SDR n=1 Tax=uncultured Microbacterium sp. TaxID=191216 RepID=A0A1Y5P2I7_9MICO|nr:SDR family NAD(P)-dependent oxidoreductase [uncultured Microbacterium sp.]SBS71740.1 putative Short-chain dehydrogenase/reductase SDR [uncultured Microbacterium sp.]